MSKNNFYENVRNNKVLTNRVYSCDEVKQIVQAQFHYFWYNINLGYPLSACAYDNLCEQEIKKIKKEVLLFRKTNIHIFKNQLKSFNTIILHLSLAKSVVTNKGRNKI